MLSQVKEKLKDFGFSEIQGRKYDPHQIISKRIHMNKNAPYEHDNMEGLDKLTNMEVCIDVEAPLQQVQTQQAPQTLVIKIPKANV